MTDLDDLSNGELLAILADDPVEAQCLGRAHADVLLLLLATIREALERLPFPCEGPEPATKPEREAPVLLTAKEAAALLNVPARRLYKSKSFEPARRPLGPRTVRFDKAALLGIIARSRPRGEDR